MEIPLRIKELPISGAIKLPSFEALGIFHEHKIQYKSESEASFLFTLPNTLDSLKA